MNKKSLIFIGLVSIILNLCCSQQALTSSFQDKKVEDSPVGFVFIDISEISNQEGTISILSQNKDTILHLQNQIISINGTKYKTYEEEHLYKKLVNAEFFEPEYGLFILKCYEATGKFYKVELNGETALISNSLTNKFEQLKSLEQYIMESYPVPTQQNPLRTNPDENAGIVDNFDKWVYLPVVIDGDWVKIVDDKDCYSGEAPSPVAIEGWIRWRKNGKFILKVGHTC
jgi:hypothetical protein